MEKVLVLMALMSRLTSALEPIPACNATLKPEFSYCNLEPMLHEFDVCIKNDFKCRIDNPREYYTEEWQENDHCSDYKCYKGFGHLTKWNIKGSVIRIWFSGVSPKPIVTVKNENEVFEPIDVQKTRTTLSPYQFKYNLTSTGYYNLTIEAPGYADVISKSFYFDISDNIVKAEPMNLFSIILGITIPIIIIIIIALLFYYCRSK